VSALCKHSSDANQFREASTPNFYWRMNVAKAKKKAAKKTTKKKTTKRK